MHTLFAGFLTMSLLCGLPSSTQAQAKTSFSIAQTEEQVLSALEKFHTPGLALGIVHKGETLLLKGYGARQLSPNKQNVDAQTYFRLASTSKAFTAAALGVLVDQKKISWQDKVIQHLPEFQMQDAWVTREFTIEDLLVHRSGLVGGAGDSMIWPEPSGFTRQEVVQNLKYLSPDYSFRSAYSYSNVLYITAGEVIERVSGQSYADFLQDAIFGPLGMQCFAGDVPKSAIENSAVPYAHNDENGIYAVPRNGIEKTAQMSVAAGGIVCNAESMTLWLKALLNPSTLPFSEEVLSDMWQSHTVLGVAETDEEWDGTHFKTYGYGWRLANMFNYKVISHTGTLSGYQAYVALIPDLELGVVVLNNGSNYGVRGAVMQHILKSFIPQNEFTESPVQNWVQAYIDYQDEQEQKYLAQKLPDPIATKPMLIEDTDILGTYSDAWFKDMIIEQQDNTLRLRSSRMLTLLGTLEPFEANKYLVRWDNQNAASDAFLIFETNFQGEVTGMKMHPFTAKERSRHEYRDMHFIKQHSTE
jgi:CubicO group peptidase (beta-lactamase class C family)